MIADSPHHKGAAFPTKHGAQAQPNARFVDPRPQLAKTEPGVCMRPAECRRDRAEGGEHLRLLLLGQRREAVLNAGLDDEHQASRQAGRR